MTTEVEVWQSWLFQRSTILIYHIQSTKFYRASKGPQYFTTVMLVSIWKNECSFARHDSIHLFSFYFVYESLGKKPVTDCHDNTPKMLHLLLMVKDFETYKLRFSKSSSRFLQKVSHNNFLTKWTVLSCIFLKIGRKLKYLLRYSSL